MMGMRRIFAGSFIAIMTVGVLHAATPEDTTGIASVKYVGENAVLKAGHTANRIAVTDANGNVVDGTVTASGGISASVSGGKLTITGTPATASTTGAGNVVSSVSAENGAITATKGITAVTTVSASGTGNVITGVSQNGATVTLTKGTINVPTSVSDLAGAADLENATANKVQAVPDDMVAAVKSTTNYPSMAVANEIAIQRASDAVASKLNQNQGTTNANKAMVVNAAGAVVPGQVVEAGIATDAVTTAKIKDANVTKAKLESAVQTSLNKADGSVQTSQGTGAAKKVMTTNSSGAIGAHSITGSGATTVTVSDTGDITISSTDTDTKYTLPDASATVKGGVTVGSNINVAAGKISVPNANGSTTAGVVKAGSNITITDGVISTHAPVTPGNGTITIKQGGTLKGSFTVNQTGATTIELTDNNTTYTASGSNGVSASVSGSAITVSGVAATATTVGVAKLGVIPVGENGTATATMWVEE